MAAGLGSRFGGTKQLAIIGTEGEAFLDFAINDAAAAGVQKVVLIIRTDIADDVERHIDSRGYSVPIVYVMQDQLGAARDKPWGTGHAVLAAASEVDGNFIVINADDYYGASTYRLLADAAHGMALDQALLAGFRLDQTLPEIGEVSRGICEVAGSELVSLVETHGIGRQTDGTITATDPAGRLDDDTIASMNCWVFSPRLMDELKTGFDSFYAEHGHEPKTEFLLPSVVNDLMHSGELTVSVVPTSEPWIGVTNPADLEVARRRIRSMRS